MSASVDAAGLALGLLADTALKSTAVLLGAGLIARAAPWASAAARHAVWACALAALPAMGAATWAARGADVSLAASAGWLWLWLVGVGVAIAPLLFGAAALLRARHVGDRQGDLVWSDAVDVPMTFAWTILMPQGARAWSPEQLRAARLHEAAHVRRGDWWVHVGAWVVCALLWFHPLVWWARGRLTLEAERAADDRVLAAGVRPSAYAQQLLGLSRGPLAGLSMGRSVTSVRVRAILGSPPRGRRRWPVALLALVLSGVFGPPLVGWAAWAPAPAVLDCEPAGVSP